jgi:FkbM family methyltransferase
MDAVNLINSLLERTGIQIKRYPSLDIRRRLILMKGFGINKILDIGASTGIYGHEMRKFGYRDKIISFEPLPEAFRELLKRTARDAQWSAINCAIGNFDGETLINRSINSVSSSILDILPVHYEADPDSKYLSQEKVRICRLDSVFNSHFEAGDKIYLKIDTQGFEKQVLEGAENSLPRVTGLQLELSIAELYKGESGYREMIEQLDSYGFSLYSIENGFFNPKSGRLLQFDGIFFRSID